MMRVGLLQSVENPKRNTKVLQRGKNSDPKQASCLSCNISSSLDILLGSELKALPLWVHKDLIFPFRVTLLQALCLHYVLLNLPAITS
jgi:hypothetical protein